MHNRLRVNQELFTWAILPYISSSILTFPEVMSLCVGDYIKLASYRLRHMNQKIHLQLNLNNHENELASSQLSTEISCAKDEQVNIVGAQEAAHLASDTHIAKRNGNS